MGHARTHILCLLALALTGCWTTAEDVDSGPPPGVSSSPSDSQAQRIAEADAMRSSGNYEQALTLLQAVLAENPTITTAYVGVGEIHLAQRDFQSAEPAFARAAKLEPANFQAQYGHGVALQMLGRLVEAVRAFRRALDLQPENPRANLGMAMTLVASRDAAGALAFAEKAVANEPANGTARANLGAIYEEIGRSDEAIEAYLAAIELLGNQPPLLMNLINALGKEKRYREAANTAAVLLRIEETANACERLGWCHFKLREYEESTAAYRRAIELDPDHWLSWNGLGVNALNRWLLSDRADDRARVEARDALRRSLSINPRQERVIDLMLKYKF